MKSISFDNPYLLLLFIPLALAIVIPYLLAFRRDRRAKAPLLSMILHLTIAAAVTLAVAGLSTTAVMTETHVIVVADVSHSTREPQRIDALLSNIEEKLPENSRVGLVCFGRDAVLMAAPGEPMPSVTAAAVDGSATDIAGALRYTAELFRPDVIKRVLLVTDGHATDRNGDAALVSAVDALYAKDIFVDAVYLDNNLDENAREIQISEVAELTSTAYLGRESRAAVLVDTSYDTQAIAELYCNGVLRSVRAVTLYRNALNRVSFELQTDTPGEFDYEVRIKADEDLTPINNTYTFTQRIGSEIKLLLVTDDPADVTRAEELYGNGAEIVTCMNGHGVPTTVEALCEFDEILISDIDVKTIPDLSAFVDALTKAVSVLGKSLLVAGDLHIQNQSDPAILALQKLLPVTYGNDDSTPKLYTLVVDNSRSMQNAARLLMMKEAAKELIDLIDKNDHVAIVSFAGNATVLQIPTPATDKEALKKVIDDITPIQGTFLGKGLSVAHELIGELAYETKQVMLISDGMTYTLEKDNPVEVARQMAKAGIRVSAINPNSREGAAELERIANAGNGKVYSIQNENSIHDFIFSEVADDVTMSVVDGTLCPIRIEKTGDPALQGILSIDATLGFVFSKAKPSATTAATVKYPGKELYAPLYAHWSYDSGRVAVLTTTVGGSWNALWTVGTNGYRFASSLVGVNVPQQRLDHPFRLNIDLDGCYAAIEVIPASVRHDATVTMELTSPDGSVLERTLTFDSQRYFHEIKTDAVGKYTLRVLYTAGDKSYPATATFHLPYLPEYDAFTLFDASVLYAAVRDRGSVTEGAVPVLENEEGRTATYKMTFELPLMILAVVLYITDIIIRKLKWSDVKSFFGRKQRKGGGKAV